ncbi:MAG: TrbG/VirB9 family P-type conjugative transfer protein [Verrucomicrobia subdivision 3 bacterium]|nr:TrbG/VirB9 family P-type conjugative transfer protein [Limisphaerales bacterium]
MKSPISILLLATTVALAAPPEAIQRMTLDERVVVIVPVSTNRVTTISFPEPIAAIDAVGVTADGKTPGKFQLAHTKGSSFVSVRALARKAATNLNIRWNKRTYVFELIEGDAPVLALNLEDRAATESVQPAPQVTPTRLLALLDKAKAFPLLKKQQPEAVADADARTFGDEPQITDFNDYEIRVEEVFRFNTEDTLVFHVTLRNKSEREIRYLPESFCVRVGNRLYHQSISDAPGLLPPHAASTVYFAITGTPNGGRNEISLKNEFSVLVSRMPSAPTSATTTQTTLPPLQPQPAPSPAHATGMTPEQEARAREALHRAIADLEKTNAPNAKPTNP